MPLPLLVPAAIIGGNWIANIVAKGSQIAVLIGIAATALKIYSIIMILWAAFWACCAYFAKDILVWFTDFILELVAAAMEAVGAPDAMSQMVSLILKLPPIFLDIYTWLGVFSGFQMVLSAYFLNMALRSIPFIGGLFRS